MYNTSICCRLAGAIVGGVCGHSASGREVFSGNLLEGRRRIRCHLLHGCAHHAPGAHLHILSAPWTASHHHFYFLSYISIPRSSVLRRTRYIEQDLNTRLLGCQNAPPLQDADLNSLPVQILLTRAEKDYPTNSPPPLRFIRSCSSSLAAPTLHKLEATFHVPVLEVRILPSHHSYPENSD
jgi:hypothetical protein